jgi:hypothetical protein
MRTPTRRAAPALLLAVPTVPTVGRYRVGVQEVHSAEHEN